MKAEKYDITMSLLLWKYRSRKSVRNPQIFRGRVDTVEHSGQSHVKGSIIINRSTDKFSIKFENLKDAV